MTNAEFIQKLKLPTSKEQLTYYYIIEKGTGEYSTSVQLMVVNNNRDIGTKEPGQVRVKIKNIRLKKPYEFYNSLNDGKKITDVNYNKDDRYLSTIGQVAELFLCEYDTGTGGHLKIGKWKYVLQGTELSEATKALKKYRDEIVKHFTK